MTRYLSVEELLAIHDEMLARFGGLKGVRDANALSSAIGRPQTGDYSDVIEQAAALFESLAQNHPFIDGNTRTAFTAAAVFLRLNGYKLFGLRALQSSAHPLKTNQNTQALPAIFTAVGLSPADQ